LARRGRTKRIPPPRTSAAREEGAAPEGPGGAAAGSASRSPPPPSAPRALPSLPPPRAPRPRPPASSISSSEKAWYASRTSSSGGPSGGLPPPPFEPAPRRRSGAARAAERQQQRLEVPRDARREGVDLRGGGGGGGGGGGSRSRERGAGERKDGVVADGAGREGGEAAPLASGLPRPPFPVLSPSCERLAGKSCLHGEEEEEEEEREGGEFSGHEKKMFLLSLSSVRSREAERGKKNENALSQSSTAFPHLHYRVFCSRSSPRPFFRKVPSSIDPKSLSSLLSSARTPLKSRFLSPLNGGELSSTPRRPETAALFFFPFDAANDVDDDDGGRKKTSSHDGHDHGRHLLRGTQRAPTMDQLDAQPWADEDRTGERLRAV